jgi:hypothetical protein
VSAVRKSWFDPDNSLSFQRYYRQMESWQRALADGRVQPSEVEAQAQRVAALLRELEPTLSDEQHARVTDILGELAVLQAMQASVAQVQAQVRTDGKQYRCPNADLQALTGLIADRFRANDLEVETTGEGGGWLVRAKKGKGDGWRTVFGLVYDVDVRLTPTPDGFVAKLDLGDWTDKIISGALTLVGLWPWLLTGGVGLYNEWRIMQEAEETIEQYVLARGGAPVTP